VTAHCEIVRMLALRGQSPNKFLLTTPRKDCCCRQSPADFCAQIQQQPSKIGADDIRFLRTYGFGEQHILEAIVTVDLLIRQYRRIRSLEPCRTFTTAESKRNWGRLGRCVGRSGTRCRLVILRQRGLPCGPRDGHSASCRTSDSRLLNLKSSSRPLPAS